MKLRDTLLTLACAALLTACGGGGGSGAPVPLVTPTPTPAPTQTPASQVAVSPSTMSFTASGATQKATVSEANYSGAFVATADPASCSNVASVAPASGTPNAFTVTSGSAAGTCSISIADSYGQKATITVTVTLTQGTIQ